MTTTDKQQELYNKIFKGLKESFARLIESKKEKNAKLVIMKDNKIVKVKAEQFSSH